MATINVLRPCVIHSGPNEYSMEPGIHVVPENVAATAIGHNLAERVDEPAPEPVPEYVIPEPEPEPVVEEAPDKALHLVKTRRKSTSRRHKG